MPTADAHSIMATTEDRDELQARIAALQSEVEVLRAANAQLTGAAGRRAGDLTARSVGSEAEKPKTVPQLTRSP